MSPEEGSGGGEPESLSLNTALRQVGTRKKGRSGGAVVHEGKLSTVSWPLAPQTCEFLQLCAVKSTAAGWQQGVVIKA